MIIETRSGKSFDTATDLTAPERHILQKLMIWESMTSGIDEFREKKKAAMLRGWNDSGPIGESDALRLIVADMEERVISRVENESNA